MNFFDGLDFVTAASKKGSSGRHRKSFKDYYGLQFFHGGRFELVFEGASLDLDGSWALLTYPGPFFDYGPPEGESSWHSYICFKGPRVERYLESGLLPLDRERPLLRVSAPQRLQEAIDAFLEIPNPNAKGFHEEAVNLLEGILLQLSRQPEPLKIAPRLLSAFDALRADLRSRPELDWDFHSEAKRMGVSYNHFRGLFKSLTGLPPGEFLLEERLEKAARMLVETSAPVREVAERCGFSDMFYFSRAFKKRRSLPPLRYRGECAGI